MTIPHLIILERRPAPYRVDNDNDVVESGGPIGLAIMVLVAAFIGAVLAIGGVL